MTLFLLLIIILCLYICILLCFLSLTFVLFHSYSNQFQIFKGKVVSFPRIVMSFPILHTFSPHLTHPFNPNLHPYPLHTYDNHKYPFLNTHSFIFLFISFQQRFFCFILLFIFSILSTYSFIYSILYPINLLTLIPSSSPFSTLSPNQITLILSLNLLCFILYLCYHYEKDKRIYIKETNH